MVHNNIMININGVPKGGKITLPLKHSLELSNYEMALVHLTTYNSLCNVPDTTISFRSNSAMSPGVGRIYIPSGAYNISDINNIIKTHFAPANPGFTLEADPTTLRCRINLVSVDDVILGEVLYKVLGFSKQKQNRSGLSDNIVNIDPIKNIIITADCVEPNMITSKSDLIHGIYCFYPDVASGKRYTERPHHPVFFPITKHTLTSITITLLNSETLYPINMGGENFDCTLLLRPIFTS